jgi:hypothetical protein
MKTPTHDFAVALLTASSLILAVPPQQAVGGAPETSGVPGSPSATTTISGRQLPAPDPEFGGEIKQNALQSKAWWAPRIVPP